MCAGRPHGRHDRGHGCERVRQHMHIGCAIVVVRMIMMMACVAVIMGVEQELRLFRPRLVVNQTRNRADLDLGPALRAAGRRALGLGIDYLGHLETDDAVWLAVRKRRPLVIEHPESLLPRPVKVQP